MQKNRTHVQSRSKKEDYENAAGGKKQENVGQHFRERGRFWLDGAMSGRMRQICLPVHVLIQSAE